MIGEEIQTADNLKIRLEKHEIKPGETYNPRHHGQHYHVETRKDKNADWGRKNIIKIKPENYQLGESTGFLPREYYPGII